MPSHAAQDAWTSYRRAVDDLYQLGGPGPQDRGEVSLRVNRLEERLDEVVTQSERLQSELAADLTIEHLAQRELVGLKLLAAAAYDLSIAADTALVDEEGPAAATDRAAASEVLTDPDLRRILDAPPGAGTLGIVVVDRGARASDPAEAAAELQERIWEFLEEIPDRTAKVGMQAVAGMGGLAGGVLPAAASLPVEELLARVPDGVSSLLRRAARLVTAAVAKLQAAIGGEDQADARKQASGWLGEINGEAKLVAGLVGRLYEVNRIRAEVDQLMEAAAGWPEAHRYNKINETLEELLARHGTTVKTLTWVLRALSLVKKPLLAAVPWGPLAIGAGYVGALGYVVHAGGDYLDWYRFGDATWLDRVHGLRTTIREAVARDAA